jgi:hypothetical protein
LATAAIRARKQALRSSASAGSEKLRLRHQGKKIGRSQAECDVAFTPGLQIVPAVRAHVVKGLGGRRAALRRKRRKKRARVSANCLAGDACDTPITCAALRNETAVSPPDLSCSRQRRSSSIRRSPW